MTPPHAICRDKQETQGASDVLEATTASLIMVDNRPYCPVVRPSMHHYDASFSPVLSVERGGLRRLRDPEQGAIGMQTMVIASCWNPPHLFRMPRSSRNALRSVLSDREISLQSPPPPMRHQAFLPPFSSIFQILVSFLFPAPAAEPSKINHGK